MDPEDRGAGADAPIARDVAGFYAVALLDLGRRTGALAAVLAGPGTAADIAGRAGLDLRNTQEWLRGMTAAGYVEHERGVFRATAATAEAFRGGLAFDPEIVLEFIRRVPHLLADVATAMRTGGGVPAARYAEVAGDLLGRFNVPAYDTLLVGDWLASVPGLHEALTDGVEVAELGCAAGHAAVLLGRTFPRSRITGIDINDEPFERGRKEVAAAGLTNVEFVRADAATMPGDRRYDLIYMLDALHHFADPPAALAAVGRVLRPGGVFVAVEGTMTGALDEDATEPFAVVSYAAGLLYCMQDSLAAGGPAYGAAVPEPVVRELLLEAGLRPLPPHRSESGYTVYAALHGSAPAHR